MECLFGTAPATVAEAVKVVTESPPSEADEKELELREALLAAIAEVAGTRNGGVDNRRLGTWLGSVQGKIAGGLRFTSPNERSGVRVWSATKAMA